MKWGNTYLFVASTEEQGTEHLHETCGASVEKPKSRNPNQFMMTTIQMNGDSIFY
jgi:hypothetical protein